MQNFEKLKPIMPKEGFKRRTESPKAERAGSQKPRWTCRASSAKTTWGWRRIRLEARFSDKFFGNKAVGSMITRLKRQISDKCGRSALNYNPQFHDKKREVVMA
jgi:hypothetical protein